MSYKYLDISVKDYLACRRLMRDVNEFTFTLPELQIVLATLSEADLEYRSFLQSMPSNNPNHLDNEAPQEKDQLSENSSDFEQLRRLKARQLHRKLLSLTHPDKTGDDRTEVLGMTFQDIRELSREGEVELLEYLRIHAGIDVSASPDDMKEAEQTISRKMMARLSKLKATNSYKLAVLYYSCRSDFIVNSKLIIQDQIDIIRTRTSELKSRLVNPSIEQPTVALLGEPNA